jgi:mevalonate kinase
VTAHALFVPGRLCIAGEHSDWAGEMRAAHPALAPGHCLVTMTEQGLRAEASRGDAFEVSSPDPDGRGVLRERLEGTRAALDATARAGGFFSYAAGVAAEAAARWGIGGLSLRITEASLPIGKGLSSSAAACVLVARAFDRCYDLGLDVHGEMDLAYAGERRAGSACGRMDQVCAYGRRTVFLTFDGPRLDVEPIAAGGTFHILVVDLRAAKDTRRILADLSACLPDAPGALAAGVREALGPRNAALLARVRAAILAGDAPGLGALLVEAQTTFDALVAPASPELVAPRLHAVLAHPAVGELAFGGKGVGSQGDGCAQLLARGPEERETLARRLEQDLGVRCLRVTLAPATCPRRAAPWRAPAPPAPRSPPAAPRAGARRP